MQDRTRVEQTDSWLSKHSRPHSEDDVLGGKVLTREVRRVGGINFVMLSDVKEITGRKKKSDS